MLDETCLANQGRHGVDAAIRFGVLFPEGRVLSLDACGCVGCCFSCFGFRFGCFDGLASGGTLCLLDVLVGRVWCVLHEFGWMISMGRRLVSIFLRLQSA